MFCAMLISSRGGPLAAERSAATWWTPMVAPAPARRSSPPATPRGQDEAQYFPASTSVANFLSRISLPIASASVTEPPGEFSTTVLMYSLCLPTSAAKLCEIPGEILPIAINLLPLTRSNVIGAASAPVGSGSGDRRLSPPGNNGAKTRGTRLGRLSVGEARCGPGGGDQALGMIIPP